MLKKTYYEDIEILLYCFNKIKTRYFNRGRDIEEGQATTTFSILYEGLGNCHTVIGYFKICILIVPENSFWTNNTYSISSYHSN